MYEMCEEVRLEEQQYLINKYGIKLCKQIFDDAKDVSHSYYKLIFKDFEWER